MIFSKRKNRGVERSQGKRNICNTQYPRHSGATVGKVLVMGGLLHDSRIHEKLIVVVWITGFRSTFNLSFDGCASLSIYDK